MDKLHPSKKRLVLGTALWGWGIEKREAFRLLDAFVENGGSVIDTATNYPIDQCPEHYGLALKWIADWRSARPEIPIAIIAKLGARDNSGGSGNDLSPKKLISEKNQLVDLLKDSLSCLTVHWDNRGDRPGDDESIYQTVAVMRHFHDEGLTVGLSGIVHPRLYYEADKTLADQWLIQVKENFLTCAARQKYAEYFNHAKYIAYGINMGGVKNQRDGPRSSLELRKISVDRARTNHLSTFLGSNHGIQPYPRSVSDLALAFAYANPHLCGVIIGPRNVEQLLDTMTYWNKLTSLSNLPSQFRALDELASLVRS